MYKMTVVYVLLGVVFIGLAALGVITLAVLLLGYLLHTERHPENRAFASRLVKRCVLAVAVIVAIATAALWALPSALPLDWP